MYVLLLSYMTKICEMFELVYNNFVSRSCQDCENVRLIYCIYVKLVLLSHNYSGRWIASSYV